MNMTADLKIEPTDAPDQESCSIPIPDLLTRDYHFLTVLKMAEVVAQHRTPVLIEGESGTGKELLARFLHARSPRRSAPFVAINCAAIPEALLESELFGYEKGAFTGALASHEGKFEMANGGTLLLDEIADLAPALQVKLLRVLQEFEVDRLGARRPIPVDVRVVATTNQPLKKLVAQGKFREDLYYRISVFPLKLSPLRERIGDLGVLVPHFIRKHNAGEEKEVAPEVFTRLSTYSFRGNIRELENVLARAVVLAYDQERIGAEHIHFERIEEESEGAAGESGLTLREMEKRLIIRTLQDHQGNRTHASRALDISIRTLRNKLREYRMNGEYVESADAAR